MRTPTASTRARPRRAKAATASARLAMPAPARRTAATVTSSALHALDTELELQPGADRDQLDRALDGHVLETAELVGGYER